MDRTPHIEKVKVNDNCIVLYSQRLEAIPEGWTYEQYLENEKHRKKRQAEELREMKKKGIIPEKSFKGVRKPGIISKGAQSKIMKRVSLLIWKAGAKKVSKRGKFIYNPSKITFCTLTIPGEQVHTDNEIKKLCLAPFLQELKIYHGTKLYLWKAEKTTAGNLHFHILLSNTIHYEAIRNRWNRIINKLGYIDRYSQKMLSMSEAEYLKKYSDNKHANDRRTPAQIARAYQMGRVDGFRNPNSTDIHRIKSARSAEAYISKYLSKKIIEKTGDESIITHEQVGQADHTIQGNLWYCNEDLQLKDTSTEVTPKLRRLSEILENLFTDRVKQMSDYCRIIKVSIQEQIALKIYDFFDIYKLNLQPI